MAKWFSASPPAFLTSAGLLHPLLQRIQPPASSSSPNGPIRHCATVVATSPCFPRAGRIRPRWDGHDATGQEQPSALGASAKPAKVTSESPCETPGCGESRGHASRHGSARRSAAPRGTPAKGATGALVLGMEVGRRGAPGGWRVCWLFSGR